jgi:hypothetical protein
MAQNDKVQDLFRKINTELGGESIEVELEDADFSMAFESAVDSYRTMSSNCMNEGWAFLYIEPGQMDYQLPREVDSVKEIRRQRAGIIAGEAFEPFSASFLKQILTGANSQIGFEGFATFDFAMQYQELIGRMFGEQIGFYFDHDNSRLRIMQVVRSREVVAVQCSYLKSVDQLLDDHFARRWLREYTKARCMATLGEKYRKFGTVPGPQGAGQLKGAELINDSKERIKELEDEVFNYRDGGEPPLPYIG